MTESTPSTPSKHSSWTRLPWIDALALFVLTAILILPLFRIDYLDNWMSIEGSFISDARFIRDHWPHPGWHALWYCGTRFDYVYPPLTRYGAAVVSMILRVEPARGYHIYTGMTYCLEVAGLYLLVRVGSGSRIWAWAAGCGSALLSPAFLLMKGYRDDSLHWMPERLNVLIKWGEGPHTSALAFVPWGLAFSLIALRGGKRWTVAAAALACALVVSNNLYGAYALGIFFPLLLWGTLVARGFEWRTIRRAFAIVLLSAGLCAWWLTPSFLSLTKRNLFLVALPGNPRAQALALVLAVSFAVFSWWLVRVKKISDWQVFVAGALLCFGVVVLGKYWFDFQVAGDQRRFLPELDVALILACVEGLRRLAQSSRAAAALVTALCFSFSLPYLTKAWTVFPEDRNYQRRIEYRLSEWIAANLPGSRVFATGSLSFWYTTWRDLPQVLGGSDQGAQTLMGPLARAQLTLGVDAIRDIAWFETFGADAVVMHEANSTDMYPQMKAPRKFTGLLPIIYDKDGDVIYRVPRRPGLARVVDEQTMARLAPIPWSEYDRDQLQAFSRAMESIPQAAVYTRPGLDVIEVSATTSAGQSIAVQENFDKGWRAWVDGVAVPVVADAFGFMRVRTSPGAHRVRFAWQAPSETRWGVALTALSLLAISAIFYRSMRTGI